MEILNRDMQVAKRDKMRHLPAVYRYKALWALEWAWQLFLNVVVGVRVGVASVWALKWAWQFFFGSIDRY